MLSNPGCLILSYKGYPITTVIVDPSDIVDYVTVVFDDSTSIPIPMKDIKFKFKHLAATIKKHKDFDTRSGDSPRCYIFKTNERFGILCTDTKVVSINGATF